MTKSGELSDGILYDKSDKSVSTTKPTPKSKISEGNRKAAMGYADAHFHFDLSTGKMGIKTINLTALSNAAGECRFAVGVNFLIISKRSKTCSW